MQHIEPETLAVLALGEPADDATAAHLATCAECAAEVASLTATVRTARTVGADATLTAPPPEVWAGIRDELGLDRALDPETSATRPTALPGEDQGGDELAARRARRVGKSSRGRGWWVGVAAAAGVVVGAAGGALVAGGIADGEPEPERAVVAQGVLDPLPGWDDAGGNAIVEEGPDGVRELVVTLEGGTGLGGYREVWLIDREVSRLVSLGVLVGETGRFVVPTGLDLAEFPVVDVSDEPYDGDPAHSGDSIIRGLLDT